MKTTTEIAHEPVCKKTRDRVAALNMHPAGHLHVKGCLQNIGFCAELCWNAVRHYRQVANHRHDDVSTWKQKQLAGLARKCKQADADLVKEMKSLHRFGIRITRCTPPAEKD